MLQIGLIGNGAFGKLIVHHLRDYAEFTVYDAQLPGSSLEDTLAQPIIIFAIPAQELEAFLTGNKDLLSETALYIDVCSVKVRPVHTMLVHLPKNAQILATHPMFGPATAADSLTGRKIMLHPARISDEAYAACKTFLTNLGLRLIEVSPDEHDHAMAYVQGLSHYIGRIMQQMDIPATELSTLAYDDLYDMKRVQGNDSDALFGSILHENPYTLGVLSQFEDARKAVDEQFSV